MNKPFALLAFTILSGIIFSAGSQRPQFSFRIHVEAGDQIRDERVVPLGLTAPNEIIRVHKLPVLDEKSIAGAIPTSSGGVLISFNQAGRHLLETATRTEMGQTMVVIMNGRVIYAAEIDMAMSSGRFLIPGGLEETDITLLMEYIKQRNKY